MSKEVSLEIAESLGIISEEYDRINEILGSPFTTPQLLPFAMEGEVFASSSYHADNIAPALLGGFTLIRGYDPLDIKHIPYPNDLYCAVIHPDLEFKTKEGAKITKTKDKIA